MKIISVIGTRPDIIKMSPLIKSIEKRNFANQIILHSGQHYDKIMSEIFIKELKLPEPNYFLDTGSGTHAGQIAKMMVEIEKIILKDKPDLVFVPTDTNTTLAAALAASKLGVYCVHVEAGCRSFDFSMPEEINRRLVTHMCDFHFAPTKLCYNNLLNEGIPKSDINFTGHTIVEAVNNYYKDVIRKSSSTLNNFGLEPEEYALLTFHRQENVDNKEKLINIINSVKKIDEKIFFSMHPRTKKKMIEFGLLDKITKLKNVIVNDPIGYFDMLTLIENSKFVMTDSGGIQQEAFILHTPCVTLRCNTEWYETIEFGTNFLVGTDEKRIISTVNKVLENYNNLKKLFFKIKNPFGDGTASKKMIKTVEKLNERELHKKTCDMVLGEYPKVHKT